MQNLLGRNLAQFLDEPLVFIGLIVISVGIAIALLSRRIARVAKHKNKIKEDDKVYVTFKIIGLMLVIAGFILVGTDIIMYILGK
ncbi:MAG: hypothetical protein EOM55_02660 [Clostridia bacterium]|nr:hypothetical protein [Clostridia bacterium]